MIVNSADGGRDTAPDSDSGEVTALERWTAVRAVLEPFWVSLQGGWGSGMPGPPSREMCRYSVEAVRLFGGLEWQVVTGLVVTEDIPDGATHAWSEHVHTGTTLDLTGDQFGYPPVQLGPLPAGYRVRPWRRPHQWTAEAFHARAWQWFVQVAAMAKHGDRGRPDVGILCPWCGCWEPVVDALHSPDRARLWCCGWCATVGSGRHERPAVYGDGEPYASFTTGPAELPGGVR